MSDDLNPQLDSIDRKLLAKYVVARNKEKPPRKGDYVIYPDGQTKRMSVYLKDEDVLCMHEARFSEIWLLLTSRGVNGGGGMGSGRNQIPLSKLIDTGETMPGEFLFFHHDGPPWGGSVKVQLPCRVYRLEQKALQEIERLFLERVERNYGENTKGFEQFKREYEHDRHCTF
jgi:hypothetical protein